MGRAADVAAAGAFADDAVMTFRVADPEASLAGVRLLTDAPVLAPDFRPAGPLWELVAARPPLARLEYLLELHYPGGGAKVVTDPANPRQVSGAFGRKSVLEMPGYRPPAWLSAPADPGSWQDVEVPAMDAVISGRIWSPRGTATSTPLPLLVVHDGPEYDVLASLTQYLGAGVRGGWLPVMRAALLSPGQRNSWYSASPRYASALCRLVVPALGRQVATTLRLGMGTSLGALAMLHAHTRYRRSFEALFLQSGSFFTPGLDGQERRFPHFRRITAFTAQMNAGREPGEPVPVVLTCGVIEENIANNRLMTATLRTHGYPADLHEDADLHNYTAWRDAFDPHLTGLLRQVMPG
jgi:enterochelin esterase-like enzyme